MNRQLKVMFVDDESLTRSLLNNCIDWQALGYEVVAEAASAFEALDLVESHHPDLMITDINMPVMNGIELSRTVLNMYPETKIVILTGYDEFEFARECIKIGVSDFLLKPVDDEEITRIVTKVRQEILDAHTQQADYAEMQQHLESNRPFMQERVFHQLIYGQFDQTRLEQSLAYLKMNVSPGTLQTAVIEVTHSEWTEELAIYYRMKLREAATQYWHENPHVEVNHDHEQNTVLLLSGDTPWSDMLESMKTALMTQLKCSITVGVGQQVTAYNRIKSSYRTAMDALHYSVITGKNQVIYYTDIHLDSNQDTIFDEDDARLLMTYLKSGLANESQKLLNRVFTACSAGGIEPEITSIRMLAINILSVTMNVADEMNLDMQRVLQGGRHHFDQVFLMSTLPQMQQYITAVIERILDEIATSQDQKVNQIVVQIVNYIAAHYSDPELTLTRLSKEFYINLSHLSRIFKQETGDTFVKYLNKIRMKEAIRLIESTRMKAYQIAESIGISDPHYFGICFKRYTGMTIHEYRKSKPTSIQANSTKNMQKK